MAQLWTWWVDAPQCRSEDMGVGEEDGGERMMADGLSPGRFAPVEAWRGSLTTDVKLGDGVGTMEGDPDGKGVKGVVETVLGCALGAMG